MVSKLSELLSWLLISDPDLGSRSQKRHGSHPGSATLQLLSLPLWSDENRMKFSSVSRSALIWLPVILIRFDNLEIRIQKPFLR
jgi:hypothetical protein